MFITLALLFSLLVTAYAQSIKPRPAQECAFARAGSKLYIQGGRTGSDIINQHYALDLATSWPVTSPPWTELKPGHTTYLFNAVATPDNKTLIMFVRGENSSIIMPKYDIQTNSWGAAPLSLTPDQDYRYGIRPVIDPINWLVYIAAFQNLDIFNPNTSTISLTPMPADIFKSRLFSGAVYNPLRKSIMYFGGINASIVIDPLATQVTEYSIGTNTWRTFPTVGEPPVARSDFCMASSEDGNTIVVYGGRIAPPANYTNTFYTLDVPTGRWTRGPDGDVRLYMACIIIGDQFLAWGGTDGVKTLDGPPVVFDLAQRKWVNTYTAPAYYRKDTNPSSSSSSPGSIPSDAPPPVTKSSGSNLGAILGGTFGVLSVVALSGLVYFYLKRRQGHVRYNEASEQQNASNNEKPAETHQKLDNSQPRNPQILGLRQTSARDPQGISDYRLSSSVPQPVFSSPSYDHQQYTVSSKNVLLPPIDSQLSNTPVIYIPNSSYPTVIPGATVTTPYTPTQTTPNGDVYQAYSIAPSGLSQNVGTLNGSVSGSPHDFNAPTYSSVTPIPPPAPYVSNQSYVPQNVFNLSAATFTPGITSHTATPSASPVNAQGNDNTESQAPFPPPPNLSPRPVKSNTSHYTQ
ncbi:hypothetical protein BX616_010616 [Lobosporangium transversale]|nr:hypothetical protein BX616_010616 [Lobosporangium transversale]